MTAAVRVTAWPYTDGFGEPRTVTEVPSLSTDWLSAPVLPLKLASPLYVTATPCEPGLKLEIVSTAAPADNVTVPRVVDVVVSTNVRVPVGVPAPGLTA